MTTAIESVCAYLRDAPSPTNPSVPDEVLASARDEGVLLLLADRLRLRSFADELREAAVVEALRTRELRDVLAQLAGAGIQAVLLKGAALAQTHYERPELRPRIDTDLMIPAASREDVAHVLADLKYERETEIEGELAVGQFHFSKIDAHGVRHALDVHWRASNARAFADVVVYEELIGRAVAVPALGPYALAPSAVHGLLIACVHRIAHHNDTPRLLWLYDVHLIVKALTLEERAAFAELVSARRMRAVCIRTLTLAQEAFGGIDPQWIATLAPANTVHEPSAAFVGGRLRQVDILKSDLAATPWPSRLRLLREHLFPSPTYMRQRFPRCPAMLLPLAYACRIVVGAPRWVRR